MRNTPSKETTEKNYFLRFSTNKHTPKKKQKKKKKEKRTHSKYRRKKGARYFQAKNQHT